MNTLKKLMLLTMRTDLGARYRDRRGHYASDAMSCLRDLYWKATGEPETDKIDFLGQMRMLIGKAIEEQLVAGLIERAHHVGLHQVSAQVQVGGSNPNWDGALDALVYEFETGQRYVIEIKTKSGAGADYFCNTFDPGESYLAQMGLYLKDLSEKKVTDKGCFIFVLMSDKHFGEMVQIDCNYKEGFVYATKVTTSWGEERALEYSFDVREVLSRLAALDQHIATRTTPQPSYQYKYELTEDRLASLSDYTLKAMLAGNKVAGDWQCRYSKFFAKQLEVDGTSREYTADEIEKIKGEYNRRLTPTGRKRKQIA